jgi:hypothetical protein
LGKNAEVTEQATIALKSALSHRKVTCSGAAAELTKMNALWTAPFYQDSEQIHKKAQIKQSKEEERIIGKQMEQTSI